MKEGIQPRHTPNFAERAQQGANVRLAQIDRLRDSLAQDGMVLAQVDTHKPSYPSRFRQAIVPVAAALDLIAAACGAPQPTDQNIPNPPGIVEPAPVQDTEPKVSFPIASEKAPIKGATPEATAIPSKYKVSGESIAYKTENGETLKVPSIPGLKAELQRSSDGDKVTYSAKTENPYGLAANEYAGIYKPDVSLEIEGVKKQTGGVSLTSAVSSYLLEEKLAGYSTEKDKWAIAIPLDITESTKPVSVGFKTEQLGNRSHPFLTINTEENIPLVNMILGSDSLRILITNSAPEYKQYLNPPPLIQPKPGQPVDQGVKSFVVLFPTEKYPKPETITSSFGDGVDSITGTVKIAHLPNAITTQGEKIEPERILAIDSTPVFVSKNPQK